MDLCPCCWLLGPHIPAVYPWLFAVDSLELSLLEALCSNSSVVGFGAFLIQSLSRIHLWIFVLAVGCWDRIFRLSQIFVDLRHQFLRLLPSFPGIVALAAARSALPVLLRPPFRRPTISPFIHLSVSALSRQLLFGRSSQLVAAPSWYWRPPSSWALARAPPTSWAHLGVATLVCVALRAEVNLCTNLRAKARPSALVVGVQSDSGRLLRSIVTEPRRRGRSPRRTARRG